MKELEYHILIVDDQSDIRRLFRSALETFNAAYRIVDVPSGEEAMLVVSGQPLDLLIADVGLPGISGLELIERAKKRNPSLKLILVTGLTDPKIRRQVAEGQADAYFIKPVDILDLLKTVERCLKETGRNEPKQAEVEKQKEAPGVDQVLRTAARRTGAQAVALFDANQQLHAITESWPPWAGQPDQLKALAGWLAGAWQLQRAIGDSSDYPISWYGGNAGFLALWLKNGSAVVLLTRAGKDMAWAERAVQAVRELAAELPSLASRPEVKKEPAPEPEISLADIQADQDLASVVDALLGGPTGQAYQPGEVDAFWEAAAEDESLRSSRRSDVFDYRQAKKKGLAPE